jgi:glycosyltransferase involved in cell wall biosynthesis
MNAAPLVTIAIPTFNRAEGYLSEALESALGQTYSNLEILVSDNCSTDGTKALVTSISDPRLRYVRHEQNIGQRKNYAFCFEQAKGAYVLLLHDDDTVDDDFVSTCVEAAGAGDAAAIIRTGVRLMNAQGKVTHQITNEAARLPIDTFFRSWFAGRAPIYCCNTLFSREKLLEVGGFESKHYCYPDTAAIFKLAARYPRIDVREAKANYRIHGGEVTYSRTIGDWCEDSLELLHLMCELVPEQSKNEVAKLGTRFFAKANYVRASAGRSPTERAAAVMKVMRYFNYRELPSRHHLLNVLYGTRMYNAARAIKRRALNCCRGAAAPQ